jgi:hypothetical protein
MERDWAKAAEEAADDHAARSASARAADLAGALVKVARLASGGALMPLPASAFYDGGGVERRVRRLLSGATPATRMPGWLLAAHACGFVLVLMAASGAIEPRFLQNVQWVVELFVAHLP